MKGEIKCRSCGQANLSSVLSLGRTPLANALLKAEQLAEPEETYQLDLIFCPHCTLVQITETVPPEKLFREYYYFSSFSDTMLRHSQELVERLIAMRRLQATSLVVEVASNDGYLLQYYKQAGIPVLGIEPAANIARIAEAERGIPTLCEFFSETLAQQLREQGRSADVIHANNVLAHIAELNGAVRGLNRIPARPLDHPCYSEEYLRELATKNGWRVSSVNNPEKFIQHHLVCRPAPKGKVAKLDSDAR
jgi:hypothetical protein